MVEQLAACTLIVSALLAVIIWQLVKIRHAVEMTRNLAWIRVHNEPYRGD
jgi:hypothetical protein